MIIYFDIETLPTDDAFLIDELSKDVTPPANIKKQESRDKWIKENFSNELNNAIRKSSLNGMFGKVACIAWSVDDGEIMSTSPLNNENEAIKMFYDSIRELSTGYASFCGHNLHGFDLPFLKHRSIINKIAPPLVLINAMNARPWDDQIKDTMLMWSAEKNKMVSMKRLCNILGIEYEEVLGGSMVSETWPNDPQKVIDYCMDDVSRTREIYKRISFNF